MMRGGFAITSGRPRRGPADTFVPMINIVFLLLIFFMLSATIAPPDPFDMLLPQADGAENGAATGGSVLYVAADGGLVYGGLRDDAARADLSRRDADAGPLILRADAGLDGTAFAALLAQLAALGVTDVTVTVRQP